MKHTTTRQQHGLMDYSYSREDTRNAPCVQECSSSLAIPFQITWQVNTEDPITNTCVVVVESTKPFYAMLTQHLAQGSQQMEAEQDGQVYSLVIKGLTAEHIVHVYNEQSVLALNGLSLRLDEEGVQG
jgi:hypothetical protein